MKRLMNYLRGVAYVAVTGNFPERLINLCAQERITFWSVEWKDDHSLTMRIHCRSLKTLQELTLRCGCQMQVVKEQGLPVFLHRFRDRYGFLLGLLLALCAVSVMSRFILTIEVTGNERIPTAVILTQLRQLGVRQGVYGPGVDRTQVAQEVMYHMEELAWVGINLHGTRLEVIVREVVQKPEPIDEAQWYDVQAEADGIITHVEAELGDALVQEGDTVSKGEVLISGTVTMEPPQYSDLPARYYQTHARGRVWARTWRTLSASIPLVTETKVYTGEEKCRWFISIWGAQHTLFGGEGGGEQAEKIVSMRRWTLPDGTIFPVYLGEEVFRNYKLEKTEINEKEAQHLLEQRLCRRLEEAVGEEGEIHEKEWNVQEKNGSLVVTLKAECTEEIGEEQPGRPLPGQGAG